MSVLGLIPARGGSKALPHKNILPVAGKPLIAWTIECAQRSRLLTRFLVSTDDEEIAAVARQYGAPVEMRPPELARDETPMFPVLRHHAQPSDVAIMVLQPTCPLRRPEDIDGAIELYQQPDTASVISFVHHPDIHPARMYRQSPSTGLMCPIEERDVHARRQDLEPCFLRSGDIYLTGRHLLANFDHYCLVRPWMIPPERHCNIDGPEDLARAEWLLQREMACS